MKKGRTGYERKPISSQSYLRFLIFVSDPFKPVNKTSLCECYLIGSLFGGYCMRRLYMMQWKRVSRSDGVLLKVMF